MAADKDAHDAIIEAMRLLATGQQEINRRIIDTLAKAEESFKLQHQVLLKLMAEIDELREGQRKPD